MDKYTFAKEQELTLDPLPAWRRPRGRVRLIERTELQGLRPRQEPRSSIDELTAFPAWDGGPLDLDWAIEALWHPPTDGSGDVPAETSMGVRAD